MKTLSIAALLVSLLWYLGAAAPAGAEQPSVSQIAAPQIAFVLERLHAPGRPLLRIDSSCSTSCSTAPEGSCTKSCPASQSCVATCSGGKAVCSCQ